MNISQWMLYCLTNVRSSNPWQACCLDKVKLNQDLTQVEWEVFRTQRAREAQSLSMGTKENLENTF
jgi:hypothetical protein